VLRRCDLPLNRKHPFSEWWIENALELRQRFPAIFDRLKDIVTTPSFDVRPRWNDEKDRVDLAGLINAALDRLRQLESRLAPTEKVRLTREDFSFS
jgi:hypothetical protein